MLRLSFAIARKDLLLTLARGNGLMQALLLGLLLLFVFSLAHGPGERASPQAASAMFWLSSVFSQVLIFNRLYDLEEANAARLGLALCPAPIQAVWLGKLVAGLLLLLLAQAVFLPASVIFLNQSPQAQPLAGLAALILVDLGICALGSLLGALAQGQSGRESLMGVILFPLLTPLLLAGIAVGAQCLGSSTQESAAWLRLACAFDAVFLGAGLVLFGFIYPGED